MFCLLLSQPDESLLCALSLGPVSSQQMLQQKASCLFYLCRSDVINIRFALLCLLRNKTVGQISCTLLLNPQLYCKTASPSSKKSSLQLSGYKVSAQIKGIAFPPPPPHLSLWPLLPASLLTWQIQHPLCLPSSRDIQATGPWLSVLAAIFGPSLPKPLFQIKSKHSTAFLSWYSLLRVRWLMAQEPLPALMTNYRVCSCWVWPAAVPPQLHPPPCPQTHHAHLSQASLPSASSFILLQLGEGVAVRGILERSTVGFHEPLTSFIKSVLICSCGFYSMNHMFWFCVKYCTSKAQLLGKCCVDMKIMNLDH